MNNIVTYSVIEALKALLKLIENEDLDNKDFELALRVAIMCTDSHSRLLDDINDLICENKNLKRIIAMSENTNIVQ